MVQQRTTHNIIYTSTIRAFPDVLRHFNTSTKGKYQQDNKSAGNRLKIVHLSYPSKFTRINAILDTFSTWMRVYIPRGEKVEKTSNTHSKKRI